MGGRGWGGNGDKWGERGGGTLGLWGGHRGPRWVRPASASASPTTTENTEAEGVWGEGGFNRPSWRNNHFDVGDAPCPPFTKFYKAGPPCGVSTALRAGRWQASRGTTRHALLACVLPKLESRGCASDGEGEVSETIRPQRNGVVVKWGDERPAVHRLGGIRQSRSVEGEDGWPWAARLDHNKLFEVLARRGNVQSRRGRLNALVGHDDHDVRIGGEGVDEGREVRIQHLPKKRMQTASALTGSLTGTGWRPCARDVSAFDQRRDSHPPPEGWCRRRAARRARPEEE